MPPIWGDLYKPIKDLLTKNYNGDQFKLEVKTKDTVTFNPTFTRNADSSVVAATSVEGEYDPCSHIHLKLKYGINNKGLFSTKVTADKFYPGMKIEGNADMSLGEEVSKDTYELKTEYKHPKLAFVSLVNQKKDQMFTESNAVFNYEGLNVGGSIAYNLTKLKQESINFGTSFDLSKDTSVTAILENFNNLKTGFITVSKQYTFAGEYTTTIADFKKGTITLGSETKLKDGQVVKGKLNSAGVVAASLQHKLSSELKLVSSIEVDTNKNWASKFGVQLTYES